MTTAVASPSDIRTLADLLRGLGDIPPDRVLFDPLPGTATVQDVINVHARSKRLCELVDGTLVEKGMGYKESVLAIAIAAALREFVLPRNLGLVSGESGMMKLFAGLVRIPDVAYASWERIPGRRMPVEPVPHLVP
ncbi:MAG: Uma2 family endonuclease, partial [Tepidisphaeraceae bacterium]